MKTRIKQAAEALKRLSKAILNSLRHQVAALAATYSMIVAVFILLHISVGERWPIVAAFNMVAHFLTLLTLPALCLALLVPRYRWLWAAYALPGILAFVFWYGPLLLPKAPVRNVDAGLTLDIITYNVAGSMDALANWRAGAFDADIIGFQELSDDVEVQAPYSDLIIARNRRGTFSNNELIEPPQFIYQDRHGRPIDDAGIRTVYRIAGQPISVYSLHPTRPEITLRPLALIRYEQDRAVNDALEMIRNDPHPVIVLCDCNFSDRTDYYKRFAAVLNDAWAEGGVGLGWTAPVIHAGASLFFPLIRVDYIWHSAHFETLDARVLPLTWSDHYAVQATLRLRPQAD